MPASTYQAPYGPSSGSLALDRSNETDLDDEDSESRALRDIDNLFSRPIPELPPDPTRQINSNHQVINTTARQRPRHQYQSSVDSAVPFNLNAGPLAAHAPVPRAENVPRPGLRDYAQAPHRESYHDPRSDGRFRSQQEQSAYMVEDPWNIEDDGESLRSAEGPSRSPQRSSKLAVLPGIIGAPSASARVFNPRDGSGNYGKLENQAHHNEKSAWMTEQKASKKRTRCIIWSIVAIILVLGIAGGVVGGLLAKKNHSSTSSSGSGSSSTDSTNGLTASSSQVKAVLNNTNLHRVFPGMDYTPLHAQYPACLTVPPAQDNVTLDVAVMSQLTPAIRLYGTDCNQTEMVLTAIDRLDMNSTLKVWLGVWLGNNDTTNARQLAQMYDVLSTYPSSHFAGIIVGNEVLYRKDLTLATLADTLAGVKKNLTDMSIDLPVATSDLGDNWTTALAADTDVIMANVHPFFAGVTAADAAAWTWEFWQSHDVSLGSDANQTDGVPRNLISETGWPSTGGNDCGTDGGCTSDTAGSVAGIDEMNTYMDSWVCQALANGTAYFWFEAFDEPWKVIYDTDTDGWEPHWGLMDANRNLKDGLKIPDCDGKTAG
ncbi:hypothetical protein MBLNU459_g4956t1 [Dothideomycetes sp. NU459]